MLTAHLKFEVNWEADADGVQFRLTNSTTLPAGAELFNHYGEKGNEVRTPIRCS